MLLFSTLGGIKWHDVGCRGVGLLLVDRGHLDCGDGAFGSFVAEASAATVEGLLITIKVVEI